MSAARWFLLACALSPGACADPGVELALDIRESSQRKLFVSVERLSFYAERDGRTLVERSFPATTDAVSVRGVPYGPRTIVVLEGTSAGGDVVARGQTCPIDFVARDGAATRHVALYFAPTNSFAPTLGPPLAVRRDPVVLTPGSGEVIVAGGDAGGITASAERYSVSSSSFAPSDSDLAVARRGAQVIDVAPIGALVTGGIGADGGSVALAELYRYDSGLFFSIEHAAIGARAGHRSVLLPDGRVLLSGGGSVGTAPVATTALIRVQSDGTAAAAVGPVLVRARREHAAVVASGIPVLIGGFVADGTPTSSIEALVPTDGGGPGAFAEIASLRTPRAEATATLLEDGTILVVGGAGDALGTPLLDAEVFNPIIGRTEVYPLAVARRGHTATLLPAGRVLVVGGIGADGVPLSSVELFIPGVGFVSERPLSTPRVGHRTVALCDGTVLVVGGGAGAELYTPPP